MIIDTKMLGGHAGLNKFYRLDKDRLDYDRQKHQFKKCLNVLIGRHTIFQTV